MPSMLFALLCLPLAVSAQSTLLRLAPPQGQVSHYRIRVNTSIDMAQGSMDASSYLAMTAIVRSAHGDERTIETVVDSFRIEAPGIPMPQMPALVGSSTTVRMSTRGQVLETTYSSEALTQAFGGMAGPQGSSFQAGMTLPEQPVAPGYTWSDSNTVQTEAGPMGAASVTTKADYTLDRVEHRNGARIAVVRIVGTITQSAAMVSMTGTMEGAMTFDLDAGRWIDNQMTVQMQMNGGGQDASMRLRTHAELVP